MRIGSIREDDGPMIPNRKDESDPLVMLRKSSLEVLGAIKDMELRYRLPDSGNRSANGGDDEGEDADSGELQWWVKNFWTAFDALNEYVFHSFW